MCELLAISSQQPARLTFPLTTMVAHSSDDNHLLDGWGIAYYQGKDIALIREPLAACNSALMQCLEKQSTETTLAICHLRHATQGDISLANTAPFARELAGRMHAFAHNGHFRGMEKTGYPATGSYQSIGETDSEQAFCTLLGRMKELWQSTDGTPALVSRMNVIAAFASELRTLGPANFLYADSDTLFAHGDRRLNPETGKNIDVSKNTFQTNSDALEAILVASTPLNDGEWQPFAEGELVAIRDGAVVESILTTGGAQRAES